MLYTLEEHQNKAKVSKTIKETATVSSNIQPEKLTVLNEAAKDKKNRKLLVKMEAIHVGRTANYTFYTEEGLKGGLKSWTSPYNKPVLTHHNAYSGEPIGRIVEAEYSEQNVSGRPGLVFTVEISDPDAVEKVLDGRYQTVSIGATTDKVTCNICATDRTEDWCEHYPGDEYEGQTCHFIVGTTEGKEVSYVNTPADKDAGNRSIQIVDGEGGQGDSQESQALTIIQMAEGLVHTSTDPEVNLFEHVSDGLKNMLNAVTTTEGSEPPMTVPNSNQQQQAPENTPPVNQKPEEQQQGGQASAPEQTTAPEQTATQEAATQANTGNDLSEMQQTISNLVMEKMKIESQLNEMKTENQRLVQENTQLMESSHKALAEKVVALKQSLQKTDVVSVGIEAAVESHVKRTRESLEDSLKDLMEEAKRLRPEPNSVQSPGATNEHEDDNEISLKEGVKIFSGLFGR